MINNFGGIVSSLLTADARLKTGEAWPKAGKAYAYIHLLIKTRQSTFKTIKIEILQIEQIWEWIRAQHNILDMLNLRSC